jgi:dipeptidyl aminopeptidase/acylaminoacyl peptidase
MTTPLLLVHGEQDHSVQLSQSVELFNTLRRLGRAPVVLLEYKGEEHVFSDAGRGDVERRKAQFFDHYLKGEPALVAVWECVRRTGCD